MGGELGNGLALAREDQGRGNFGERFQDETPLNGARMGQDKRRGIASFRAESNQIEIDRTGFVEDLLRGAPEFFFKGLQYEKE